jgi:outer membrane protein OmpA-like peptidoglycan-associated protein
LINKILLAIVILFLFALLGWCSPQCSNQITKIDTPVNNATPSTEADTDAKKLMEKSVNSVIGSDTETNQANPPALTISSTPAAATAVTLESNITPVTNQTQSIPVPTPATDPVTPKPEAMGIATDGTNKEEPTAEKPAISNGQTKIILEGVNFKSNSDELTNSSIVALEKVIASLKQKKDIKIEIAGYTDNTGNAAQNIALSQQRAESVVTYIKNSGINATRLSAKGYGATSPVADNNTTSGRLKNRRVELHIK